MSEIDSNPFADPAFSHPFQVTLLATLAALALALCHSRDLTLLTRWAFWKRKLFKRNIYTVNFKIKLLFASFEVCQYWCTTLPGWSDLGRVKVVFVFLVIDVCYFCWNKQNVNYFTA